MGKFVDLTGKQFGRLTVLRKGETYLSKNGSKRFKWVCKCECGNIVEVIPSSLVRGGTQSCGCLQKEAAKKNSQASVKHRMIHTRLYRIWSGMKDRCINSNSPNYKYYGERGIKYASEWEEFIPFYKWAISNGYQDNLSLDRKNVNSNYCPGNCRWITQKEQCNNKQHNCLLSICGCTKTISEWTEYFNVSYYQLYSIYQKQHNFHTLEEVILLLPKSRRKPVICEGRFFDWAESCSNYYNINKGTMVGWLNGRSPMPQEWKNKNLHYETEQEYLSRIIKDFKIIK